MDGLSTLIESHGYEIYGINAMWSHMQLTTAVPHGEAILSPRDPAFLISLFVCSSLSLWALPQVKHFIFEIVPSS